MIYLDVIIFFLFLYFFFIVQVYMKREVNRNWRLKNKWVEIYSITMCDWCEVIFWVLMVQIHLAHVKCMEDWDIHPWEFPLEMEWFVSYVLYHLFLSLSSRLFSFPLFLNKSSLLVMNLSYIRNPSKIVKLSFWMGHL